jgi:hypothetical protein
MTERRALILFLSAILLTQALLFGSLSLLEADSDQFVLAYVLLLVVGGLGVGEIVSRYHHR